MTQTLLSRLIPDGELLLDTVGQYSLTKSSSTYMATVNSITKSFDMLQKAYWHIISIIEPIRCTESLIIGHLPFQHITPAGCAGTVEDILHDHIKKLSAVMYLHRFKLNGDYMTVITNTPRVATNTQIGRTNGV